MKHVFGSLLLMTVLMLGGCGGDEAAENGTPAAVPGTEVPTQTTTVVVSLPEEGGTDTAAPAEPAGTSTGPATPAPAASPTP